MKFKLLLFCISIGMLITFLFPIVPGYLPDMKGEIIHWGFYSGMSEPVDSTDLIFVEGIGGLVGLCGGLFILNNRKEKKLNG